MTQTFYNRITEALETAHALADAEGNRNLLSIITPVIRPAGVAAVERSIAEVNPHPLEIRHLVARYPYAPDPACGPQRAQWATDLIRSVRDGWILFVDDDNRLHPELPARLAWLAQNCPDAQAFVFSCQYPEMHQGRILAQPGIMRPGSVDGGQVVLWWKLAQSRAWPSGDCADGQYLAGLYRAYQPRFVFEPQLLTYHNHQVWG
jgi:hypothetical protein